MKAVTAVKLLFLLLPFVSGEKKSGEALHGSSAVAEKVDDPPSSVLRGLHSLQDKTQTEDRTLMKSQEPLVDRHDHLRHRGYDQHRRLSDLNSLPCSANPCLIYDLRYFASGVVDLFPWDDDTVHGPHDEWFRSVKIKNYELDFNYIIDFRNYPGAPGDGYSMNKVLITWPTNNRTLEKEGEVTTLPGITESTLPWITDSEELKVSVHRIDIDSTYPAEATICMTFNADGICCHDSDDLVNSYTQNYLCRCEGDCDSDMDCVGDLVCFTRDGDEEVPGCSGAGRTGKDYCTDRPNSHYLAYVGNSGRPASAFPLGLCEADCDSDSDCDEAEGLCCFKRKKFTPVPQCDGAGTYGKDYCIQDNWESELVYDNVPWNLLRGFLMAPTHAYNATGNSQFRSLLDDFTVPARHVWTINQFRWAHFWSGGNSEIGVGVELSILEDNDGVPGDVIHAHIDIASYAEVDTGDTIPNNSGHRMDSTATFTSPLLLQPGTYWFEAYVLVDPSYHGSNSAKNWWLCGDQNDATAGWYNYTDGNGLQPSWCNLNFILKGTVVTDCSL